MYVCMYVCMCMYIYIYIDTYTQICVVRCSTTNDRLHSIIVQGTMQL